MELSSNAGGRAAEPAILPYNDIIYEQAKKKNIYDALMITLL